MTRPSIGDWAGWQRPRLMLLFTCLPALFAGALLPLALSPFDLWPCALVSILLLHVLSSKASRGRGLAAFYAYGVGVYGVGASWVYVSIQEHGGAAPPLALLLVLGFVLGLALLFALMGYVYLRWVRDRAFGLTLGFAALWAMREWLTTWLLTGFPWLFAGYGFIDTWLAGLGPVAGVLGISYLVALMAALAGRVFYQPEPGAKEPIARRGLALAGIAVIWLAGLGLSQVAWVKPAGDSLSVSAVQGNIDQHSKWQRASVQPILDTYTRLSEPEWGRDLVVWPEASVTLFRQSAGAFLGPLGRHADARGSTLVLGIPDRDENGRFLNTALAVGNGEGSYIKRRLVPFGEYVPLEQWLRGTIAFLDLPMSRNVAGPEGQPPLRVGPWRVALSICYEVVYPELVRTTVTAPDLLITISNDTWFGRSIGPWQHLQMARMRALENGRGLVRATNNGVTAIIDHQGRITAQLPQFEPGVLRGDVPVMTGLTPFARFGHWPLYLLVLLTLLAVGLLPDSRRGTTVSERAIR